MYWSVRHKEEYCSPTNKGPITVHFVHPHCVCAVRAIHAVNTWTQIHHKSIKIWNVWHALLLSHNAPSSFVNEHDLPNWNTLTEYKSLRYSTTPWEPLFDVIIYHWMLEVYYFCQLLEIQVRKWFHEYCRWWNYCIWDVFHGVWEKVLWITLVHEFAFESYLDFAVILSLLPKF